ncbi:uncharacterized protein CC84DRAFT_1225350 [Paraphaeosphaeria sporulosa]|uniref:Uncharacterized protein n=1 Tax=Paraphaeosphaeria sporulosa TaxID=1460663 RepID=A0A177CW87_9PLEO|nr:uncharacterized protein CC84DRAFT_1225350 [Paraphaeosphaeria sporulosa]OAG11815.1 hypothetical protein CC84DRAFT_1225350 [Paraphaeosphaeria sporulosa]
MWLLLMVGFNASLAQHLPLVEGIVLVHYVLAFFAFLLIFWTMADRLPACGVFTTLYDCGGGARLEHPLSSVSPGHCGASSVHMPELTWRRNSRTPQSCRKGHNFPTGVPVLQAVYNATKPITNTIIMGTVLVVLLFFAALSVTAASSRQTWAFLRDKGLQISSWIEYVWPG